MIKKSVTESRNDLDTKLTSYGLSSDVIRTIKNKYMSDPYEYYVNRYTLNYGHDTNINSYHSIGDTLLSHRIDDIATISENNYIKEHILTNVNPIITHHK